MIPEIKDPSDWHIVSDMLKKLIQKTPEFYHDYQRLTKNIEIKIKDLCVIDMQIRKQDSIFWQQNRKDKLKEINDIVRMFTKMHLLASLAKR